MPMIPMMIAAMTGTMYRNAPTRAAFENPRLGVNHYILLRSAEPAICDTCNLNMGSLGSSCLTLLEQDQALEVRDQLIY